eukprot:2551042-Amphidinium_carterae.1
MVGNSGPVAKAEVKESDAALPLYAVSKGRTPGRKTSRTCSNKWQIGLIEFPRRLLSSSI